MLAIVFTLLTPAFACGDKGCSEAGCSMPATTAAAPAALPAGSTVAKLKVNGMTCGSCSEKVKTALTTAGGTVTSINVETGVAEVGYDAAKVKVDALVAAVNATGHFTATAM